MNAIMGLIFLGLISAAAVAQNQQYTNKYDNVNIETILSNDRVLSNYIKCLLEKGACTREGRELKSKFIYLVDIIIIKSYSVLHI